MNIQIFHKGKSYKADLSQPIDISIPLRTGEKNVNCFYAPFMEVSPVISDDFIGSTEKGGSLNFMNVSLNPHGNGTHTECVGHIAKEKYTINQCLTKFWFLCSVITIEPETRENDKVITLEQIKKAYSSTEYQNDAIAIRTSPNHTSKKDHHYSGTNPTYVEAEAIRYLIQEGIQHLLIDLPSVDREEDGGALAAHKSFWEYPNNTKSERTITELIFIPDRVKDGNYLLNIQIASFEIDVSPSKPVLYEIF